MERIKNQKYVQFRLDILCKKKNNNNNNTNLFRINNGSFKVLEFTLQVFYIISNFRTIECYYVNFLIRDYQKTVPLYQNVP